MKITYHAISSLSITSSFEGSKILSNIINLAGNLHFTVRHNKFTFYRYTQQIYILPLDTTNLHFTVRHNKFTFYH
jgi:hypothetical protein